LLPVGYQFLVCVGGNNVILTDEKNIIVGTLTRQKWKDRTIKPGLEYTPPKGGYSWKNMSKTRMKEIFAISEKKNAAVSIATEIGLGGRYAEELCSRAKIDKNILPNKLSSDNINKLHIALTNLVNDLLKPKGYLYEDGVSPIELSERKLIDLKPSFMEALSLLKPKKIDSPYQTKIERLKRTLKEQSLAIINLEEKAQKFSKIGEEIYNNYTEINEFINLAKNEDWNKIKKTLEKNPKIKNVDLKKKSVVFCS